MLNTWQCNFLSIAHTYEFKDITDDTYVPIPINTNALTAFELQQKHAFSILVVTVNESSILPIVHQYSNPNARHYEDVQLLYRNIVMHYIQGLSGKQCLE